MAYAIGDVVLVPFPFTDLTALRVRPAVVVSSEAFNEENDDVTVAMVTSQSRRGTSDWQLRDWQDAGLRLPSWVRAKLLTLDQRLVQFSPGRLSRRDREGVRRRIRIALDL